MVRVLQWGDFAGLVTSKYLVGTRFCTQPYPELTLYYDDNTHWEEECKSGKSKGKTAKSTCKFKDSVTNRPDLPLKLRCGQLVQVSKVVKIGQIVLKTCSIVIAIIDDGPKGGQKPQRLIDLHPESTKALHNCVYSDILPNDATCNKFGLMYDVEVDLLPV